MIRSKYSIVLSVKGNKVLFNTVYGTLDLIDNSIAEKWMDNSYSWSLDEQKYLFSRGHLTTEEEQSSIEKSVSLYDTKSENHKSKFYIIYSYLCNFNCFYCFENNNRPSRTLTTDELNNIFDSVLRIISFNKTTENEIVLFGGEPLLGSNRELICRTLKFARENGIKISVITNGSNIPSYADIFLDNRDLISNFSITIDGPRATHDTRRVYKNGLGSYDDIINNISFLVSNHFAVSIRMNIDRSMPNSLRSAMAEFKQRLGFYPNLFLSLVDDTTCTGTCKDLYSYSQAMDELKNNGYFEREYGDAISLNIKPIKQIEALLSGQVVKPRFRFCRMSELYIFSTDGCIYTCPQSCENKDFLIGSYLPHIAINNQAISKMHAFSALRIADCDKCSLSPICGGGCYVKRSYYHSTRNETLCYKEDIEKAIVSYIERLI